MKYPRTWKAIDAAIEKSHALTDYQTISRLVGYMRQCPHDAELLEWNLIVCAGHEMEDNQQAPIWNEVIDIWHEEKHGEGMAKFNQIDKVARQSNKEVV